VNRHLLLIATLALVMGLATWWIGWWTVAVVGAAWGVARRGEDYPAATAGVAAGLSWCSLLAVQSTQGPVGELSRRLGGVLSVPGWVPLAAAVLFPAILAAAAAALTGTLAPAVARRDRSA
jgi:hypothetical protein